MNLAVENLKFCISTLPHHMLRGGGLGALATLMNRKQDCSFWDKVKSGITVSVVYVSFISTITTFQIINYKYRYFRPAHSLMSRLVPVSMISCSLASVISSIWLTKGIFDDLINSEGSLKERAEIEGLNAAATMTSALVGAIGMVIFSAVLNTYLGRNLSAIFQEDLKNKSCSGCS